MKKKRLVSLGSFETWLEAERATGKILVFRGQHTAKPLLPGVAREAPTIDTARKEQGALQHLRESGDPLFSPANCPDELALMAAAQHWDMKTRLLDWSRCPFVAAWFACHEHRGKGPGYLYVLDATDLEGMDPRDPFQVDRTRVIFPRYGKNARMAAQAGCFTLHRYSAEGSRGQQFFPLQENPDTQDKLTVFRIPSRLHQLLLNELDERGVNARALFPDTKGICLHANWQYLNSKEAI